MTESLFSNEGMSDLLRNTVDFIGNMHVGVYEGAFESFYKPFGYSVPGAKTQAGYYGRVVGRNTMTAIGIWQMGQGAFEMAMGLGGLGSSLGAEFVSWGGASLLALPVAGASAGLIVSGAVKVGIGVALCRSKSNDKYYDHNLDKQHNGTPRSNDAQNRQAKAARVEIEREIGRKLTREEIQKLHYAIHGQNYGYWEIVEEGVELFKNN